MNKEKNMKQRVDMVRAMETIVRNINNEDVMWGWLMCGVADGDITDETTDEEIYMDYCEDDNQFADIMSCFVRTIRRMVDDDEEFDVEEFDVEDRAKGNGYLYCDGVVSKYNEM